MSQQQLILIEFNELCPSLLDRWMADGSLPNFKRFYNSSTVFVSEADVQDRRYLEPWIQWYSVHTGLRHDQHDVFRLTDGPRAGHEDIWTYLLDKGLRVGSFSSMNVKGFEAKESFFVADPWCTTEPAYPSELGDFQQFIAHAVQDHTNASGGIPAADTFKFLKFLMTHGISARTVMRLARQLFDEKFSKGDVAWKRASMLDAVQFDIFKYYFDANKPHFSTFFSNSTAHYQHSYWRHMEPDSFTAKPAADEIDRYKGAILYGYQQMDSLLGKFFELEKAGAKLILASALSQQPYLEKESIGGQRFYRPRDVQELLGRMGVEFARIEPVMTHQYVLHTADEAAADLVVEKLRSVVMNGEPIFDVIRESECIIYFGCHVSHDVPEDSTVSIEGEGSGIRFFELLYRIDGIKSGFHHPEGVLWFKFGTHRVHDDKVSVVDIFPTIADFFGLAKSGKTARSGASLYPKLSSAVN